MKCIYFHHFWGVKSHNWFWWYYYYDGGGDDDDDYDENGDAYGKVVFFTLCGGQNEFSFGCRTWYNFCVPPVMMQISTTNITFQVVASADLVPKPDSWEHTEFAPRAWRVCCQVLWFSRSLLGEPGQGLFIPGRGKYDYEKWTVYKCGWFPFTDMIVNSLEGYRTQYQSQIVHGGRVQPCAAWG